MHLGNLLCAMLSYLSVRSQGGRFLLRIEDVDLPRCPAHRSRQCIDDLKRFGFRWDEPPLWQSERTAFYQRLLDGLTMRGLIYPCFCTRAQLQREAAPNEGDTQWIYPGTCRSLRPAEVSRLLRLRRPALRLRVPERVYSFRDLLCGEVSEELQRGCGDFVLRRSDGLFGYQLAAVADDAASGVTEVVRGRDILTATPRQLYLQELLGCPRPVYAHIPLLVDAGGRRLAKRDRDIGLSVLVRRCSPEEILGLLAAACGLLEEARPVTLEQLIPLFSWEKVRRRTEGPPERGVLRLPPIAGSGSAPQGKELP